MERFNNKIDLLIFFSGIFVCCFLILIFVGSFLVLFFYVDDFSYLYFFKDNYLWKNIFFTIYQSLLSTIFSIIPGIYIARIIFIRNLKDRFLIKLLSIITVLPVIIIIFGLIEVYGRNGIFSKFCNLLNINYSFVLYGLNGILLSHIFLNLPISIILFIQCFKNIPIEQYKISIQLSMNRFRLFQIVEWPYIKRQLLQSIAIIFMTCFSSFTPIMLFGAGFQKFSLEVMIYQLLIYDFNFCKASFLSLIEFFCFFCLSSIIKKLNVKFYIGNDSSFVENKFRLCEYETFFHKVIIFFTKCFFTLPILFIIINGINSSTLQALKEINLWKSLINSMIISFISAFLSIIFCLILLFYMNEIKTCRFAFFSKLLNFLKCLMFSTSPIVLGTSFFCFSKIRL